MNSHGISPLAYAVSPINGDTQIFNWAVSKVTEPMAGKH